jgi:uncharacterized protein (TIGR03437 family)
MTHWRSAAAVLLWTALAGAASLPTYRIETVAGSSLVGDGGPAALAQIGTIQGIAADHLGNIYISDTDHHRVRKINAAGIIVTIAGTGAPGFSGDGAAASVAQLKFPYGLAVDLAGYLYIADLGNNRVRRVAPDGIITTYAGGGHAGPGDGGPASTAQLQTPRNVAIDTAGNLYIAEFEGHRVRKVTPDGRIATVAGNGVAGYRGDGSVASNAQLAFPAGLAIDRTGALYIADSQNQRVRKILPGGAIITVVGGSTSTTLLSPIAVAVDTAGNIFAADSTNLVHCYSAAGAWNTFAGTGAPGYSGDGGPAQSAMLADVRDLAVDFSGNLLIADSVRVRRVDSSGRIQTVAGDGYLRAVGDGAQAANAMLSQPSAVALDAHGNLYIADTGTQRVRQVSSSGVITTLAGTGTAGYDRDQSPAASAELNWPTGVAAGLNGPVWIADSYNHRVRKVAGGLISTFAGIGASGTGSEGLAPQLTQLRGPQGVCADSGGTVYIVDTSNHRVLRVPPNGVVSTAAGNGAPGDAGDGGQARLAQLNQPSACVVDSLGNLFIADTFSHRIRRVSIAGVIATVAGTGQPGSALDEVPATTSPLNAPRGIAVDGDGNLFIADSANNRIREVTPDGVIHTIAGTGAAGLGEDGGDAASAQISMPLGLVVDGAGDIYFADSLNNRVRRLVPLAAAPQPPVVTAPPLAVVSAGSLVQGAVAPGELITIFGSGMGPETGLTGTTGANGLLTNLLGGAEVRFDGVPAPLFYAQAGQINAQVPYSVAGAASTHVEVLYQNRSAGTIDLSVAPAVPSLFPAIVNQDTSINSQTSPAARGTVVTLYATGEGLTNGSNIAGQPAVAPYGSPAAPVTVSIGGVTAQLLYAGRAPGFIGLMQVNAVVPGGFVPTGPAVLTLSVGSALAPLTTIWLQ